jgi:hypothetical protein
MPDVDLIQCSPAVEETLQKPGLSPADFKWCEREGAGTNIPHLLRLRVLYILHLVHLYTNMS